ncbi:MAG TPA: uracil-DNA glycosylase [Bryobacteraceae bacterium]|nr:uracil-DNA glycosylase [Bryobacteraceae bacterium]
MNADRLRQYLEFYQDLGIKDLYKRAAAATQDVEAASQEAPRAAPQDFGGTQVTFAGDAAPASLFSESAPTAGETLLQILTDIGDCKRCRLHEGRTKLVFGVGKEHAPLVFVGEGPGADEDAQGIPFVGRAGQLLTQMIENTAKKEGIGLRRDEVYICNVVKCRPPGNRAPEPDEMETCGQFLFRQLTAIRPKAICALGGTAAKALTGHKEGVTKMRGRWFQWRDIPVMITYHPSYLLRPYNQDAKREAWEDLKKVLHFVYD